MRGSGDPHRTIYDAFGYVLCNNGRMSASCKSAFTGTGNAVKYCCTGSVDTFLDVIIHSCLTNLHWFLAICYYMDMMLQEQAIRCDWPE